MPPKGRVNFEILARRYGNLIFSDKKTQKSCRSAGWSGMCISVVTYVLSKLVLLSVVGLGQVALLFAIVSAITGIPRDTTGQFWAISIAMLTGTATGLLLSAVSSAADQASTLIPIALIRRSC